MNDLIENTSLTNSICVHCWENVAGSDLTNVSDRLIRAAARKKEVDGVGISSHLAFTPPVKEESIWHLIEFCDRNYSLRSECGCCCHKKTCTTFWLKIWTGDTVFLKGEYLVKNGALELDLFMIVLTICEYFLIPNDIFVEGFIDILGPNLAQDAILLKGQMAELYSLTHFMTGELKDLNI